GQQRVWRFGGRSERDVGAGAPALGKAGAPLLHHGVQRGGDDRRGGSPWGRDRAADWRGRAGDHGAVPRSGRKRNRPLPATRLKLIVCFEVRVGILTEDMKRVVDEQRLGFVATVCPDGTPNLSPKGTTAVWDDDHIVFADIRSPATVSNLRRNPSTEINVLDPMVRKGYRFKGVASVLTDGVLFEQIVDFYRAKRNLDAGFIRSVVLV